MASLIFIKLETVIGQGTDRQLSWQLRQYLTHVTLIMWNARIYSSRYLLAVESAIQLTVFGLSTVLLITLPRERKTFSSDQKLR